MTPATIIVVEDEMIVALDIQDRLQSAGYLVPAVALSGEEAITFATQIHPDLMLMDIGLQGKLDGIQTAQQIKNQLNIPIIFLTAYGDVNSRQRAEIVSPAGFLVKPFEDSHLLSTIQEVLQAKRNS